VLWGVVKCLVLVTVLLQATASVAPAATTYYVSPTGSDAAAGTQDAPFRTINKADTVVAPGDTVRVLPGAYGPVTTFRAGTPTARIRYLSETRWAATIQADSTQRQAWNNYAAYIDVQDFEITAPNGNNAFVNRPPVAKGWGYDEFPSFVRVVGNHIHDVSTGHPTNCDGPVAVLFLGVGVEVSGNLIHDVAKCGFSTPSNPDDAYAIYGEMRGATIQNNIIYNTGTHGIVAWHAATEWVVSNNLVFKTGRAGMVLGSGEAGSTGPFDRSTVSNNIVIDPREACISEVGRTGSSNRYLNNMCFRPGPGKAFDIQTGSASGNVVGDPGLVDYRGDGSGDYRLQAGSSAIGAGTTMGAPATDFNGVAAGPESMWGRMCSRPRRRQLRCRRLPR